MTLRHWIAFIAMAAIWGGVNQVVTHVVELALRTYHARQCEIWFERNFRQHLR